LNQIDKEKEVQTTSNDIRILSILFFTKAVVSFRSIPKILNLFNIQTKAEISWIPYFYSPKTF
jgi:hypothetical protein